MNPGQNDFYFLPNVTYQEVQHCFYSEKFISKAIYLTLNIFKCEKI